MDEEVRALTKVIDRLALRYPELARTSIEITVFEEHRAMDGRPVRAYVHILVERKARARLHAHTVGLPRTADTD